MTGGLSCPGWGMLGIALSAPDPSKESRVKRLALPLVSAGHGSRV